MKWIACAVLCLGLALFFVVGASVHARVVNRSKARGDQSGYLVDAKDIYANWHGQQPPTLVGARNRMPLYPAILALFYDHTRSDDAFFERGRVVNIYLSLVLLVIVWIGARRYLPPLAAANLTGVAAFGWFIFKAGYTQSELLYYTTFFLAFAASIDLLSRGGDDLPIVQAAGLGVLCGVAQLTKASMLPFVALLGVIGAGWALSAMSDDAGARNDPGRTSRSLTRVARRAAALAVVGAMFLAVIWPYISTNKRVFGQYFYNVNSTFYVWYDDWPSASVGTRIHGDAQHWPDMPASELPGPARYWREHTVEQIGSRIADGFRDMWTVINRDFDLRPYLVTYGAAVLLLLATRRETCLSILRDHRWAVVLTGCSFASYLLLTAFYHPISGTGTGRFMLALALPLFFVASLLIASPRLRSTSWHVGPISLTTRTFEWLVSGVLLFNVAFRVWPRLMSTYGGF